jgi:hypothetical protein
MTHSNHSLFSIYIAFSDLSRVRIQNGWKGLSSPVLWGLGDAAVFVEKVCFVLTDRTAHFGFRVAVLFYLGLVECCCLERQRL